MISIGKNCNINIEKLIATRLLINANSGAGKILQHLFESYPEKLTKEEIGYATGFESSGGTFNTYISELRRNGLIEVNDGIRISEEFF